jgi:asparagine synthase (glutamine-hydrolysing)
MQQLLRYADRNSMAHSREVRLPFLSHELVEFIFTLPSTFKINEGWTKWIMRETFPILPDEIRWRTDKIGYEPPQKSWMENAEIKEKIRMFEQKLVTKKLLNESVLKREIKASHASENSAQSWLIFMAGELY